MPDPDNRTSDESVPASRPAPEFGEYAPEGWTWSPEGSEHHTSTSTSTASQPSAPTHGQVPAAHIAPAASVTRSNGQVPGVPHNLGARGSSPAGASLAPTPNPAPTQAPDAGPVSTESAQRTPQPEMHYRPTAQPTRPNGGRTVDRVFTIVLLVLGALGALYCAASLQALPSSLSVLATALGLDGFTVPDSVATLGTVGALSVLALYAVSLIYSIQRMRRGKMSFWVPLVAGVIALILVFAVSAFAIAQTPELVTVFNDPSASAKLLEYLSEMGQTAP